jgi:hypothetical protein
VAAIIPPVFMEEETRIHAMKSVFSEEKTEGPGKESLPSLEIVGRIEDASITNSADNLVENWQRGQ